ncbi:Mn2+/Zn2+ ABC transporter permease [Candidatus Omnitrophus magneticus]|uniref:Mn2+/Zn2+ ABC transporter permease n=1 Tax=Candidatus Omnitrophus magneticus TaxID=1609969 RepID=A0A0F0CVL5_9BACT|nr:Mn2+/Zn2+ ABC transporter permease [Candidatus Omnitrophus magneticus]
MFQQIQESLQYAFIQRAIIAGCFMAVGCSFLGVFLVLRRFSLIGDGLAHVSFAGVALGLFFNSQPMLISIPLVSLASLVILKLNEKAAVYGDAAIGLVSSFSIALGVIIASTSGGFNVDLFSYLFGNILSVSKLEVWLTIVISSLVAVVTIFFYHDLFSITFDEEHARVSGVNVKLVNKILILLTSFIIVLGIKIAGTMLVSSLIILPPISALQVARSFRSVIILSSIFAVISVITGIFVSYIFNLPSGATIIMINFIIFVKLFLYGRIRA